MIGRDRRFLERIVPMALVGTWPQITTIGNGIRHAIADRRDRVGGAGPEVTMAHAHAAARARVTRGHEARALLVRGHDERHLRLALLRASSLKQNTAS
jgi:hypothetical protein